MNARPSGATTTATPITTPFPPPRRSIGMATLPLRLQGRLHAPAAACNSRPTLAGELASALALHDMASELKPGLRDAVLEMAVSRIQSAGTLDSAEDASSYPS
jgi:hypothetical protein